MSDYSIKVMSRPDEDNPGFWEARAWVDGVAGAAGTARTPEMAEAFALRYLADELVARERDRRRQEAWKAETIRAAGIPAEMLTGGGEMSGLAARRQHEGGG